jgi:nicotinate-nucleotide adenylyltransferase
MGGTFDPPHKAHIAIAEASLRGVPLDTVLFMPAPEAPLKPSARVSRYEDRCEMVRLAIEGRTGFELSRLEEFRRGPSYTVDLLRHFLRAGGGEPYLILGADSVCDLPRWKEPEEILSLATLVVFPRTGYSSRVSVEGGASIVLFESPLIDLSSSEIRERIRGGGSVRGLVPDAVAEFVLDKGLYT